MNIAIVGAGFSGSVIAYKLARLGHRITVFESRSHVAGNCYTGRDTETGIMLHTYGPHIFHTNEDYIWKFVNSFDEFMPFINRVKAIASNQVYSMPINLHTINQFFGKTFSPKEAKLFIEKQAKKYIAEPISFEEQALYFVGQEIYDAFFKGYTLKQWGIHPSKLPANILKRLPLRFNYNDNYFDHKYQGIPRHGYTKIIEKMLDHSNIELRLNFYFNPKLKFDFDHVFYSGSLDKWFDCRYGNLQYRTLDFEVCRTDGDYQGNAVINYCDENIPYTRITEHKHFTLWETHEKTLYYKEYSRNCEENDIPYYPVNLVTGMNSLEKYKQLIEHEKNVTFLGRLGTFRYLDMDVTIKEALEIAEKFSKN
jgi:UDP-galactopyranose mutase